tara:strand:- start:16 stop:657 length:642 start_codon:yes stop_codon:yes gene_type:complete
MIIAVTGNFGTGKTSVANLFSKYGFKVINVDKLYHGIYNKDKVLRNKIKKEFGTIKRNELKKIVFNDSSKLKKLNKITHPVIIKEMKKEMSSIIKKTMINKYNNKKLIMEKSDKKYIEKKIKNNVNIVIDIPLLFESKLEEMFDKIIVVKCSEKEQIKRTLKKGKYSKKEIKNIINSQMSLKEKIKKADFVVDNSKMIKETEKQVKNIIEQNP